MFTKKQIEVQKFAAGVSVKPELTGTHIKGDYTEATDGRILVRVVNKQLERLGDNVELPEKAIAPEECIAKLSGMKIQKHNDPTLDFLFMSGVKSEAVEFFTLDQEMLKTTIGLPRIIEDEKYPENSAMLKKPENGSELKVNPRLLAKVLTFLKDFKEVKIITGLLGDPIRVEAEDDDNRITAIVMPLV